MPLLLLPALVCLQQAPQPLACALPDHAFGRLVQGQKVTHTFHLENRGESPVRIRELLTSCQCTTAPLPPDAILPGGRLALTVTFDSTTFEGPVEKSITVITEGSPQPLRLTLRALVQKPFRVEPALLKFGPASRHAALSLPLRLTAASGALPPAVAAVLEGEEGFSVESYPLGEERAREVVLSLKPGTPARSVRARLVLTLDTTPPTRLEVPVSGELTEDVACFPSALSLGPVGRGSVLGRRLQVLVHHPGVELRGIRSEAPWLEAVLAPRASLEAPGAKLSQARGFTASLTVAPHAPVGPHQLTLTLETTSTTQPQLRIPLTLTVE